jgi:hypothetical protein
MKWRCVIAHWQCQAVFLFFYFIFFRVVQYEERDSIVMAPQQQRSAQM